MSAQCTATMTEPMGPKTGLRGVCRCYRTAERLYALGVDGSEQVDLVCSWHATHPEGESADV